MKRFMILILTIILAVAFASSAFAIMKGSRIFVEDSKMGAVNFDVEKHKAAGKKCNDCHPKHFEKKKGSITVKMPKKHEPGEACGACHPQATDRAQCGYCHKK